MSSSLNTVPKVDFRKANKGKSRARTPPSSRQKSLSPPTPMLPLKRKARQDPATKRIKESEPEPEPEPKSMIKCTKKQKSKKRPKSKKPGQSNLRKAGAQSFYDNPTEQLLTFENSEQPAEQVGLMDCEDNSQDHPVSVETEPSATTPFLFLNQSFTESQSTSTLTGEGSMGMNGLFDEAHLSPLQVDSSEGITANELPEGPLAQSNASVSDALAQSNAIREESNLNEGTKGSENLRVQPVQTSYTPTSEEFTSSSSGSTTPRTGEAASGQLTPSELIISAASTEALIQRDSSVSLLTETEPDTVGSTTPTASYATVAEEPSTEIASLQWDQVESQPIKAEGEIPQSAIQNLPPPQSTNCSTPLTTPIQFLTATPPSELRSSPDPKSSARHPIGAPVPTLLPDQSENPSSSRDAATILIDTGDVITTSNQQDPLPNSSQSDKNLPPSSRLEDQPFTFTAPRLTQPTSGGFLNYAKSIFSAISPWSVQVPGPQTQVPRMPESQLITTTTNTSQKKKWRSKSSYDKRNLLCRTCRSHPCRFCQYRFLLCKVRLPRFRLPRFRLPRSRPQLFLRLNASSEQGVAAHGVVICLVKTVAGYELIFWAFFSANVRQGRTREGASRRLAPTQPAPLSSQLPRTTTVPAASTSTPTPSEPVHVSEEHLWHEVTGERCINAGANPKHAAQRKRPLEPPASSSSGSRHTVPTPRPNLGGDALTKLTDALMKLDHTIPPSHASKRTPHAHPSNKDDDSPCSAPTNGNTVIGSTSVNHRQRATPTTQIVQVVQQNTAELASPVHVDPNGDWLMSEDDRRPGKRPHDQDSNGSDGGSKESDGGSKESDGVLKESDEDSSSEDGNVPPPPKAKKGLKKARLRGPPRHDQNLSSEDEDGFPSVKCDCPQCHLEGCHLRSNSRPKKARRTLQDAKHRDSDDDVEDYAVQHRDRDRVELQRKVRMEVRLLMKTGKNGVALVPSEQCIADFEDSRKEKDGPQLDDFRLDLTGQSTVNAWNKRAAYVFADYFIQQPGNGSYEAKVVPLWESMPKEACSEDEAEIQDGKLLYRKLTPMWRNPAPEVDNWFKTFDLLHMSTRFQANGRQERGRLPHHRLPPDPREKPQKSNYPKSLPSNFYNKTWLSTLDDNERNLLDIQAPVDLTFEDPFIKIAQEFSHKRGRDPRSTTILGDRQQNRSCECQDCAPEGRILSPNEYDAHRARERKRQAVQNRFHETTLLHPEPDTMPDPDPAPDPEDISVKDEVHAQDMDFLDEEEKMGEKWLHSALKRVEERLAENIMHNIKRGSLRFVRNSPNEYTQQLDPELPQNTIVIEYEGWLNDQKLVLQSLELQYAHDPSLHQKITSLLQGLEKEIMAMDGLMDRELKCQLTAIERAGTSQLVNSRDYVIAPTLLLEPLNSIVYLLVVVLHLISGVSLSSCKFFISGFKVALQLADCGRSRKKPHLTYDQTLLNRVEDMINFLKLEPKSKSFDFLDWLARLYNCPGMEEHLDRARKSRSSSSTMSDIWDAPVLKDFKGPDGKSYFNYSGRESQLAFSLNMDGFNPFTNKQAGKQISTCGIYLVCLNLPPELRYRPENVFLVGVVPGPSEPHVHQINHILKPLVDIFIVLWEKGVYLVRMPKYMTGRHVFAVIIPLVCDLPATRKVAGLGGHTFSCFCSECMLTHDDIENIDIKSWERRTQENHREMAHRWKAAKTKAAQKSIFDETGVRWSEMLRLPYWDPMSYIVIDTMHCFYLGLFRRHVMEVWGMSVRTPDGEGLSFDTSKKEPSETDLERGRWIFQNGRDLAQLGLPVLIGLCRELGMRFAGKKSVVVRRLAEAQPSVSLKDPMPKLQDKSSKKQKPSTSVLGMNTLAEIRRDFERIQLPSWVPLPPSHPGETKWGKLHADQWQSLCTVYLPVTLTRLWGGKPHDSREYKMLRNFLHLVNAVKLGSMRITSIKHSEDYEFHMKKYLETLLELYPGAALSPYQHMALHVGQQLRVLDPPMLGAVLLSSGQMEKTMFRKFCMMQNLRSLLNEVTLPSSVHSIIEEFDKTFNSNVKGTLLSERLNEALRGVPIEGSLSLAARNLLIKRFKSESRKILNLPQPQLYCRIYTHGYSFAISTVSLKDSRIMFTKKKSGKWSLGSITEVFSLPSRGGLSGDDLFFCVENFADVTEAEYIPVRTVVTDFPEVLGQFFSLSKKTAALVRLDEILGQVCLGQTDYGDRVFQALPMKKAGFYPGI
ncbi:hypothetical protein NP233_g6497 [Leucocoprinus birnbaumii]|uniref:SAP domain-containing protein n=1 Tax=Leucocoprinus birnbaumii TaxID=56174 RepID=A0AAD5YQV5_9AGAR|nr:hypothetical protein NP233_g6497 [Leucocoprinus birnbaumii]